MDAKDSRHTNKFCIFGNCPNLCCKLTAMGGYLKGTGKDFGIHLTLIKIGKR